MQLIYVGSDVSRQDDLTAEKRLPASYLCPPPPPSPSPSPVLPLWLIICVSHAREPSTNLFNKRNPPKITRDYYFFRKEVVLLITPLK